MKKALAASLLIGAVAANVYAEETPDSVPSQSGQWAKFESLRWKGINLPIPGPRDTIDPDLGGFRSALASAGVGYVGYSVNNFWDNTLSAARTSNGQQLYNGQKSTLETTNVMDVTYDLSRYGIADGQIVIGGIYLQDTWNNGGPNQSSLATLSYYQTFFNKALELKAGYLNNVFEFWGVYVSGNLASSIFGPSATIPVELGINANAWSSPGLNLTIHGPDGLYSKIGIQRAISPDGTLAEKEANPTGLRWRTPNTGVLFIDEFGYRKEAAPGQMSTWVRFAPMYNTSRYNDLEYGGRRTGNHAGYFLADRQLFQVNPSPGLARRGPYAGVTAMYAPAEFNRYSQYYELRFYDIGPFASRPKDMVSLVASQNVFSKFAAASAEKASLMVHRSSTSVTASYTARLVPGVQAAVGVGYTNHPTGLTYTSTTGSALNALASLVIFW